MASARVGPRQELGLLQMSPAGVDGRWFGSSASDGRDRETLQPNGCDSRLFSQAIAGAEPLLMTAGEQTRSKSPRRSAVSGMEHMIPKALVVTDDPVSEAERGGTHAPPLDCVTASAALIRGRVGRVARIAQIIGDLSRRLGIERRTGHCRAGAKGKNDRGDRCQNREFSFHAPCVV